MVFIEQFLTDLAYEEKILKSFHKQNKIREKTAEGKNGARSRKTL